MRLSGRLDEITLAGRESRMRYLRDIDPLRNEAIGLRTDHIISYNAGLQTMSKQEVLYYVPNQIYQTQFIKKLWSLLSKMLTSSEF